MYISITAEKLFEFAHFPITNSLITAWLTMLILIIVAALIARKREMIPRGWQNMGEYVIESLRGLVESVTGSKKWANRFFPIIATFFIFIIMMNWLGLLPGIGSIGFVRTEEEGKVLVPFFRAASADLNTTLALAIISVLLTQVFGIIALGFFKYVSKFINFRGPIQFFVGILELISEISKLISFSFRLFGNIFAGEVLLVIMSVLVPLLAPLPFYALEIFVGFIQALVFAMLSLIFFNIAIQKVEH